MGIVSRLAAAALVVCVGSAPALAGPAVATFTFSVNPDPATGTHGSLLLDLTATGTTGEYVVDGISGTFSGSDQFGLNGYTAAVTGLYTGTKQGFTPDNLLYDPAVFGLPADGHGIGFTDATGRSNVIVTTSDPPSYGPTIGITQSGGIGFLTTEAVTIYPNGLPVPEPRSLALLGGAVVALAGVRRRRRAG